MYNLTYYQGSVVIGVKKQAKYARKNYKNIHKKKLNIQKDFIKMYSTF